MCWRLSSNQWRTQQQQQTVWVGHRRYDEQDSSRKRNTPQPELNNNFWRTRANKQTCCVCTTVCMLLVFLLLCVSCLLCVFFFFFLLALLLPGKCEAEGGQSGANRPRQVLPPLHRVRVQARDALELRARDPEDKPGECRAAAQGVHTVLSSTLSLCSFCRCCWCCSSAT